VNPVRPFLSQPGCDRLRVQRQKKENFLSPLFDFDVQSRTFSLFPLFFAESTLMFHCSRQPLSSFFFFPGAVSNADFLPPFPLSSLQKPDHGGA